MLRVRPDPGFRTSRRRVLWVLRTDSRLCTVDDTSSLFEYAPADAWAHDSGNDAQSYVNSTFSRTTVEGATAKFSFEGTAFWLYGAKKAEYGEYILIVDDTVSTYASATTDGAQFEQVLGGASGLENKKHTVVLMAAGGGPVDIDAIMYETTNQDEMCVPSPILLTSPSYAPSVAVKPLVAMLLRGSPQPRKSCCCTNTATSSICIGTR